VNVFTRNIKKNRLKRLLGVVEKERENRRKRSFGKKGWCRKRRGGSRMGKKEREAERERSEAKPLTRRPGGKVTGRSSNRGGCKKENIEKERVTINEYRYEEVKDADRDFIEERSMIRDAQRRDRIEVEEKEKKNSRNFI